MIWNVIHLIYLELPSMGSVKVYFLTHRTETEVNITSQRNFCFRTDFFVMFLGHLFSICFIVSLNFVISIASMVSTQS